MPAVVVGRESQKRIGKLRFPSKLCLRHGGHTDDGDAPGSVEQAFGARRELRPIDADVSPTSVHAGAGGFGGSGESARRLAANRIGESDVADDTVVEERRFPLLGEVDELIDDDELAGLDRLQHGPDCADADQVRRPQFF